MCELPGTHRAVQCRTMPGMDATEQETSMSIVPRTIPQVVVDDIARSMMRGGYQQLDDDTIRAILRGEDRRRLGGFNSHGVAVAYVEARR